MTKPTIYLRISKIMGDSAINSKQNLVARLDLLPLPLPRRLRCSMEVEAIERLLGGYKFKDRLLLEEAFTHSSVDGQPSYQRLEFVGDAALGLAVANFVFLTNPTLGPGHLTLLRSANISTEKLARAAVRHGLYRFLRHNSTTLDHVVGEFTAMVMKEAPEDAGRLQHGGYIKAPKVLADIVESFAAAVYIDCHYNLETFWKIFRGLLEPLITEETVEEQPVAALYMLCQKHGRRLDLKNQTEGSLCIVSVLVDEQLVCTASSEKKAMARINAARMALPLLPAVATGDEAADAPARASQRISRQIRIKMN